MAKARYVEPKGDDDGAAAAGPLAEQERWEKEQLARTRLGVGVASARAAAAAADAEKYELLFEDQIEYVKVGLGGARSGVFWAIWAAAAWWWSRREKCGRPPAVRVLLGRRFDRWRTAIAQGKPR